MAGKRTLLALRASAQEPRAFGLVFEENFDSMLRYMVRRVCDPEIALDLTAETFAQAYLSRKRFRGASDAEAVGWLYGIGKRQLAGYFRRSKVERRALTRLAIELPVLDAERTREVEKLGELVELREILRAELSELSESQQEALQLRIVDDLPYSAVATRLRISEEAARARVARGLKALAAALDRNPQHQEAHT